VIATSLLLWMSPTIIGLVLAIPLSWLSGSLAAGLTLKRMGLLMTPELVDELLDRVATGIARAREAVAVGGVR